MQNSTWLKLRRDQALIQQNGRCFYCNKPLSRDEATSDHKKPRKHGGLDEHGNICAACYPCNLAKGSFYTAKDFRRLVRDPAWRKKIDRERVLVQAMVFRIHKRADQAVKLIESIR